jgi:molybdenum cofactor synthesis domain-containing protein
MIRAGILTVSDSCIRGERQDISGQTIEDVLRNANFEVCRRKVVPDDKDAIAAELRLFADQAQVDVVLTTGGTGLGPCDVTPEATESVCDRLAPGLCEIIRFCGWQSTKNAVLSRGTAGIRGRTLIINLPGSPKGAAESLQIILDVLPHAVKMLHGGGH